MNINEITPSLLLNLLLRSMTSRASKRKVEIVFEDSDDEDIFNYKFRAECRADVDEFLKHLKKQIIKHSITQNEMFPDCVVEFSSRSDIDYFRRCMKTIEDGHVMYESLNYASEYTGERHYEEDDIEEF